MQREHFIKTYFWTLRVEGRAGICLLFLGKFSFVKNGCLFDRNKIILAFHKLEKFLYEIV